MLGSMIALMLLNVTNVAWGPDWGDMTGLPTTNVDTPLCGVRQQVIPNCWSICTVYKAATRVTQGNATFGLICIRVITGGGGWRVGGSNAPQYTIHAL